MELFTFPFPSSKAETLEEIRNVEPQITLPGQFIAVPDGPPLFRDHDHFWRWYQKAVDLN